VEEDIKVSTVAEAEEPAPAPAALWLGFWPKG
jgi:hypothetical protein